MRVSQLFLLIAVTASPLTAQGPPSGALRSQPAFERQEAFSMPLFSAPDSMHKSHAGTGALVGGMAGFLLAFSARGGVGDSHSLPAQAWLISIAGLALVGTVIGALIH